MTTVREALRRQQEEDKPEAMWDSGEVTKRRKKPHGYFIGEVESDSDVDYPIGVLRGYKPPPRTRRI